MNFLFHPLLPLLSLLTILTIFTLPLTTAHPTDPITAALNTAHDITSSALQNIPPPHSLLPLMCSPTGANYCNLGIATYAPAGSVKFREMYVYDRSCRGLGSVPINLDKGHLSVHSLLPWTVEVDVTGGGNKPEGYFWYAGRKTDLGRNLVCRDCQGLKDWVCCSVVFDCR